MLVNVQIPFTRQQIEQPDERSSNSTIFVDRLARREPSWSGVL
ncbi:MAG: hypothetical protein OXF86_06050 [Caldilineaceae bacterium]|nr:hypothetical protein [Caldilineaceae bacterium]